MTTPNKHPTDTDMVPEYTAELALPGLLSVDSLFTSAIHATLQTKDLSKAIILSSIKARAWSPEQLDEAVELRHERNIRLLGNAAVQKTVLVHEATLRIQYGTPAVMAAAVRHVLEMFDQPPENMSLHLIPERTIPGTEHLRGSLDDYDITRSTEYGQKVWIADGTQIAPPGSAADLEIPAYHANHVQAAAPHETALALLALHADKWANEP